MSDWSAGYVADIGYTHGYYQELNPLRIKLAFLRAGLVCPEVGTACELGFGQGISTNIHAACSVVQWYGTDFNPAQAALAQEMSSAAGTSAQLFDDSFADFARRTDLPDFDFICLHGIWSWISDENRHVIIDFIRRKLKVGGVVYISYNTLPGWAGFAPMRHLISAYATSQGGGGHGLANQIDSALAFGKDLLATSPAYLGANPTAEGRFKKLMDQDKSYLAHEYFNRDWHPMYFATVAEWMERAKLQFACSAHYPDHFDMVNMNPEQKAFLQKVPDRMFRETVRDYITNQNFRKDYWVKGMRKLTALEVTEQLRAVRVVLTRNRQEMSHKLAIGAGSIDLNESIHGALMDALADNRARTLGEIEQMLEGKGIKLSSITEAVMLLAAANFVQLAQSDEASDRCIESASQLNTYIKSKARSGGEILYLASPVVGGAVVVDRFTQLFVKAVGEGLDGPLPLANYVWNILSVQGQFLIKDGERIENPEVGISKLMGAATEFAEKQLPILRALKVV